MENNTSLNNNAVQQVNGQSKKRRTRVSKSISMPHQFARPLNAPILPITPQKNLGQTNTTEQYPITELADPQMILQSEKDKENEFKRKEVLEWNTDDVCSWLRHCTLSCYESIFREKGFVPPPPPHLLFFFPSFSSFTPSIFALFSHFLISSFCFFF
jgi:hypothetical protein